MLTMHRTGRVLSAAAVAVQICCGAPLQQQSLSDESNVHRETSRVQTSPMSGATYLRVGSGLRSLHGKRGQFVKVIDRGSKHARCATFRKTALPIEVLVINCMDVNSALRVIS